MERYIIKFDEEITNPDNVGSALYTEHQNFGFIIRPHRTFYIQKHMELAPSNTTLTVTYLVGNGIIDNVPLKI